MSTEHFVQGIPKCEAQKRGGGRWVLQMQKTIGNWHLDLRISNFYQGLHQQQKKQHQTASGNLKCRTSQPENHILYIPILGKSWINHLYECVMFPLHFLDVTVKNFDPMAEAYPFPISSGCPIGKIKKNHGFLWKCCVPHCTQWFCWSLSLRKMAISLGRLTQHVQTYPHGLSSSYCLDILVTWWSVSNSRRRPWNSAGTGETSKILPFRTSWGHGKVLKHLAVWVPHNKKMSRYQWIHHGFVCGYLSDSDSVVGSETNGSVVGWTNR